MSNGFKPSGRPKMVNCPDCKSDDDKPVNIWFETAPLGVISAFMNETGKRQTISYKVWRCLSCGHVLTEHDLDRAELAKTPKPPGKGEKKSGII